MEAQVSTLIKRAKEFARYKGVPFSKWQEDMGLSNSHFYNCRSLTKIVYDLIESRYPELDMIWLMTGKGNMLKGQKLPQDIESHYVPMLPISSLGTFDLTEDYDNCERVISPLKNIDFVLQVIGDSMTPEYSTKL